MKTKAIIFDIGGVIINVDMESCRQAFYTILGYRKIDLMLSTTQQRGMYGELEEGTVSPEEFRAYVLKDSRPGSTPEDVDRAMGSLLTGIDPGKAALLKELSGKYSLYLLSNNNPISMKFCHSIMEKEDIDWRSIFKDEFISSEMKMQKPDLAIFREAVRRTGLMAGECLFIDDSPLNAEAACKAGLKGLVYEQGSDLGALVRASVED